MLFLIIRTSGAEHVNKVVQVAEEIKRLRRRDPNSDNDELYQYTSYEDDNEDEPVIKNGRKVHKIIKLDDGVSTKGKKPCVLLLRCVYDYPDTLF